MAKYPWYGQHLRQDGLTQGLILPDFPVPDYSLVDYDALASDEDIALPINVDKADLIIMTQACDLENAKVKNVVLCTIYPLNEYLINNKLSKSKADELIGNLNSDRVGNMFLLNKPNVNPYGGAFDDFLVVKFDEQVVFPVELLKQAIERRGRMMKLLPPYREALAQAFGTFFMRIGNPQDRERTYTDYYRDFLSAATPS